MQQSMAGHSQGTEGSPFSPLQLPHHMTPNLFAERWREAHRYTPGFREYVARVAAGDTSAPALREGAATTPGIEMLNVEISSWVQVPYLLQRLRCEQIHAIFDVSLDPFYRDESVAIRAWLTAQNGTPSTSLRTSLIEQISAATSFKDFLKHASPWIENSAEWVDAHSMLNVENTLTSRRIRNSPEIGAMLPIIKTAAHFDGDTLAAAFRPIPIRSLSRSELPLMKPIGEGREGRVLRSPQGTAYKLYHQAAQVAQTSGTGARPSSAAGPGPDEQRSRNCEAQALKLARIPLWVDDYLTLPLSFLCFADDQNTLAGFEMPLLENALALSVFASPAFKRSNSLSTADQIRPFLALYDLLWELQQMKIVLSDLKFENVLVLPDGSVSLLDVDGFSVDGQVAKTYSEGYVDPRLCDPQLPTEILIKPADAEAMWYAYTVMLFEVLVGAHPFRSGVHSPPSGSAEVPDEQRSLRGLSVFHPEVKLRQIFQEALHSLPADLQNAFRAVFSDGERGQLRRSLITQLLPAGDAARQPYNPESRSPWRHREPFPTSLMVENSLIIPLETAGNGVFLLKWADHEPLVVGMAEQDSFRCELPEDLPTCHQRPLRLVDCGPHAQMYEVFSAPAGRLLLPSESRVWVKRGAEFCSRIVSRSPFGVDRPNIALNGSQIIAISTTGEVCCSPSADGPPIAKLPGELTLCAGDGFGLIFSTNERQLQDLFMVSDGVMRICGLPPVLGAISKLECLISKNNAWIFMTATPESTPMRYVLVLNKSGAVVGLTATPKIDGAWHSEGVARSAYDIGGLETPGLAVALSGEVLRLTCRDLQIVPIGKHLVSPELPGPALDFLLADEHRVFGGYR